MAAFLLTPFQPSTKIFSGNSKCRKTVVVTIIDLPTQTPNVWLGSNKQNLDAGRDLVSAHVGRAPYFSQGVPIVDFSGATTRIVIPDVSGDIYAYATQYDAGNVSPATPLHASPLNSIGICVEAF